MRLNRPETLGIIQIQVLLAVRSIGVLNNFPISRAVHINLLKPKNFSKEVQRHLHLSFEAISQVMEMVLSCFVRIGLQSVMIELVGSESLECTSATAFSLILSGCSGQAKGNALV